MVRAFLKGASIAVALFVLMMGLAYAQSGKGTSGAPVSIDPQKLMRLEGSTIEQGGDSRANNAGAAQASSSCTNFAQYYYSSGDVVAWANAILGGTLNEDVTLGYSNSTGCINALLKPVIDAGGTNYKSTDTVVAANCPGVTFGAPGVDGNGKVIALPFTPTTTACSPLPVTITITTSTGSGFLGHGIVGGASTWGVSGEQACQGVNRINDMASSVAGIDLLFEGTNDIGNSATAQAAAACLEQEIVALANANKRVIVFNNTPRTSSVSSNQQHYLAQLDRIIQQWIQGIQGINTDPRYQAVSYLSIAKECTDPATGNDLSAYSTTLPDCMPDHLHINDGGTWVAASKLATMLQGMGIGESTHELVSAQNAYDATYNLGGYRNSNPFMTGTGGSVGSSGCTGSVPTDLTLSLSGTTNATCAVSIESTRADNYPGQRFVMTVNATTGAGTSTAAYKIASAHGPATFNLSTGDPVYAGVDIWLLNTKKLNMIELDVQFLNAGSATILQCSFGVPVGTRGYYPDTGTNFALSTAGTPERMLHLETPKGASVCQVPATTNTIQLQLRFGADFSGAAASAQFTAKIYNLGLYKFINPG